MERKTCRYCQQKYVVTPLGVMAAKAGYCSFSCLERGTKNPYETKELIFVEKEPNAESFRKGENHPAAKIDEATVREIKKHLNYGMGLHEIASKFSVKKSTVESIKYGKTWRHVE